ncbi:MAG: MASE3 domain-containing protein [Parcubacteria group bacterium]|jgi:PAS domain S-box-containing protein
MNSLRLIKHEDMERLRANYRAWMFPAGIVVSSSLLFLASLQGFLLFHTLVELVMVVIAFGIFAIAWSSRKYVQNMFLLLLGISYLFVGLIYLLHILTYDGMNILAGYGVNLPAQLWIAARYLEATSFVVAFLLLKNGDKKNLPLSRSRWIFFTYALICLMIIFLIMVGGEMIQFYAYSEYLIAFIFLGALILLFRRGNIFDRGMANMLSLALILKIMAEVLFSSYISTQDFFNILGHLFQFISFLLLYKVVIEDGLMKPYRFLFLDLKKSEENYRALVEFSPDAIVVHSNGKIMYANEPAKKLFGINEDREIVGAEIIDFFGSEYREHIRLRIKNIFSGKWQQSPTMEMAVLHANGQLIPVEVKGMKIVYAGKEAIESIIRNVSEQKAAEEKIQSLARFPEEDPSPVIRALGDGQVQYANRPARRMLSHFGWSEGAALPEVLFLPVRQVLEKNIKRETEVTCVCGRVFVMVFVPSLAEDRVNLYGYEITERKLVEKELVETQAELRRKIEEQLIESYKHMGLVNRKISLLLELDRHSQDKKNRHEIVDYILASLLNLSHAKAGLLYLTNNKNHFKLISSAGLEKEKLVKLQVVNESNAKLIGQLVATGRRVNGACELMDAGCFQADLPFSYFVALPILSCSVCKGFLFLGFTDRKSMDGQELEFLDVFANHVSSALTNSAILK